MKRSSSRIHLRVKRVKHSPPGTAPGAINIPEDALKPVIKTFQYSEGFFEEKTLPDIDAIKQQVTSNPGRARHASKKCGK